MEKLNLPYDLECMKMAMLKHEETFKQQVYELHRVYQIQRMLMKNMQRSMQNQETWSLKNGTISFDYQNDYNFNKLQNQDLEQPTSNEHEIEDESEIELTLGPTSYTRRKNNPTQLNSDSIASFSSSSTSSSYKSKITVENSRVLSVEKQMRQVDRSLNQPPWFRRVLI